MEKQQRKRLKVTGLVCTNAKSQFVRTFLARMGDKWTIILLVLLAAAPGRRARFSELQKMLGGISQRMLTMTLRNLERDGLIHREVFPEVPPRVEYELTPLGFSLLEPMQQLVDWVGDNWPSINTARGAFDAR